MRRAMGTAALRLSRGLAPFSPIGAAPRAPKSSRRRRPRDDTDSPHSPADSHSQSDPHSQSSAAASASAPPRASGRFAHRHGLPPPSSRAAPAPAPALSRAALLHLLNTHASMRGNYESLQRSERVLASFSTACAEALLQAGIVRRAGSRPLADGLIAVTMNTVDAMDAASLVLPANSPLFATPIAFPRPPLAALIAAPRAMRPAMHTDSGDMLLAEMGTDGEGISAVENNHSNSNNNKNNKNNHNNHNHNRNNETNNDMKRDWNEVSEGEVSAREGTAVAFEMLREVPSAEMVRLLDTLAYFKWAKDEAALGWQRDGAALCAEIAALQTKDAATTATTTPTPKTTASGAELARLAESLIARIPRADTPNASTVDVMDLMLNVLMRVCVGRWPQLSFHDQCTVFLVCTFPWFTRDLRTESALWTTHSHLRMLWSKDIAPDYQSAFVLVQRLRRLCWMTVHDTDSATVRRLFGADINTSVDVKSKDYVSHGRSENDQPICVTSDVPIFRDVVYVLYGSCEMQQVAYEVLLLWMTHAHPSQLHRATAHSRYIGAIGIALADVDRFLTRRYRDRHRAGEWLMLSCAAREALDNSGDLAVSTLTQDSATPYLLTRLFFCNYHPVLPAIWQYVSPYRRELLWVAWRRAVARPLADMTGADMRFVDPIVAILTKNRAFRNLLMHVAVAEMRSVASVEGIRKSALDNSPRTSADHIGENTWDKGADTVELCARLVDATHTCALLLHSDALAAADSDKEKDNSEAIAMRHSVAAATRALLPHLCVDDRVLVHSLRASLYGPRAGLLGPALARLCDAAACGAVDEWLRCAEAAEDREDVEDAEDAEDCAGLHESEELCEWLRVARGADAGLADARLPSLVECCRSAAAVAQSREPPRLTKRELQATLTAGARAALRCCVGVGVGVGGGVGGAVGGGGTAPTTTAAALRRVSIADAGDAARALGPLLTASCAARAAALPAAARLEAVLLRLAPLDALTASASAPAPASAPASARTWARQLERAVRATRHTRRVAHVVLMRHYARADAADEAARALMDALVRAEMAPDAVGCGDTEALDALLACHALAAYARTTAVCGPSPSGPALPLRDVLARLLDHAEAFCRASAVSSRGDSDTVLLWITATARAAGVCVASPQDTVPSTGPDVNADDGQAEGLEARTARVFLSVLRVAQADMQRMGARPRLSFIARALIAAREASASLSLDVDVRFLSAAAAVQRGCADRRLLLRRVGVLLCAGAALPPADHTALLSVAAPLRDARDALTPRDLDAALVAIGRAAEALARQHEAQPNAEPAQANAQLRHAWSAIARRVLVDGAPARLAVRAIECAAAVTCVDTCVCQQLVAAAVVLRRDELGTAEWAALLRAARHAAEGRRAMEMCMRQPLRERIVALAEDRTGITQTEDREQQLRDLCMLVEALPEMFVGDTEFWAVLRRALRVQWGTCVAGMPEEAQQMWLQELAQSYEWAARCAGYHELSQLPIA